MITLKPCLSSSLHIVLLIIYICSILFGSYFYCTEGFGSPLQLPRPGFRENRQKTKRVLHVGDFGAKGDGFSNETEAFKSAWETACSLSKRIEVVVPEGKTFLLHPINFTGHCKAKITLRIEGTIIAPRDPDVWTGLDPYRWLYFHEVNHLTVAGGGLIDGMGQEWWAQSCKINSSNPCRHAPTAITFHKCNYLKIEGITVINSQKMQMAFTNCLRVAVNRVKVIAPAYSPNTDGIHISASHGVKIKNSRIGTGDDCISIVNNSSQILIKDIVCGPGHGISIGSLGKSNSRSQVQNVIVDGAILTNTDNGVRIKTWQGGRGFATDIVFQNILMENVSNPVIIDQYYCDSSKPCSNKTSAVKVDNISFINIQGTSASEEAINFSCSDHFPCEGLYLENINLVYYSRGYTKSFCWRAYGSSLGNVYPPPCFSCDEAFIKQKVTTETALQSF